MSLDKTNYVCYRMGMTKRYEIVDVQGRRWALTLTALKAVRIAAQIEAEKGLKCQIKEVA